MAVVGMVLTAQAQGQGSYEDLPPYTPPTGGRSAAQLWQDAQQRYRAGDHRGAAILSRQAAMAGSGIATYEMGYFYENGDGVPKSDAQAVSWLKRGAAAGNKECERELGAYYEAGGVTGPENFEAARRLYEQASKQGEFDATYNLARMYEYGLGVPLSLAQAVTLFAKAADQGNPDARQREHNLLNLYTTFDDTFPTVHERDLFFDEGPRLAPTGKVFHSLDEHLAFERTQHGVKRDPASRQKLHDLDVKANNVLMAQDAARMREWLKLHPNDPSVGKKWLGLQIWRQSNPGYRAPGVPF
jgi:TPR repeat protein